MPLRVTTPTTENIQAVINDWVELLVQERYADAYDLTLHDPYYQWSPANIESTINGYGLPYDGAGQKCKVTSPSIATNENNRNPYKQIVFFDNPLKHKQRLPDMQAIGHVVFDLPINGEWSDLTATFTIFKGIDFFMLELNEIHVL